MPRPGGRDPLRPGAVAWFWEGTFACAARSSSGAGGWPGHFFYGHEGIELVWRIWDLGYVTWYAPDIVVNHPSTAPTRHDVYYRMNARNRVWVARRNLPWPLVGGLPAQLVLLTLLRFRSVRRCGSGSPASVRVSGRARASGARSRGGRSGG